MAEPFRLSTRLRFPTQIGPDRIGDRSSECALLWQPRRPLTPSPAPNQSAAAAQGPALCALLAHATSTAVVQLRSYYRNITVRLSLCIWWAFSTFGCFFLSLLAVRSSPGCFQAFHCKDSTPAALLAGKGRSAPERFTEWVKRRLSCMTPIARIRGSRQPLSTRKPLLAPAGSPSRRKSPLQRGLWCHLIFILSTCAWRSLYLRIESCQLTFCSATM